MLLVQGPRSGPSLSLVLMSCALSEQGSSFVDWPGFGGLFVPSPFWMLGAHRLLWFRTVLACSFALWLAFASYRPLLACQDLLASPHLLFLCWGFGSSWLLLSLRLLCLAALSCLGVLPTCLCSWLRVGLGGSSVLHWCSRRVDGSAAAVHPC